MKIDNNQLTRLFMDETKRKLKEARQTVQELTTLIEITQKHCPHDWQSDGEDPRNGRQHFKCKFCDDEKTE